MQRKKMVSYLRPKKLWQITGAAISYVVFGLGALLVGCFFRLLAPASFISGETKQASIRWCIHKGCLAFIRLMRFFGLINYTFKIDSLVQAQSARIIIANHPSLIDAILLLAVNKQLCCIVKSAVWESAFTGPVVRLAGFIPNKAEQLLAMAADKLNAGQSILVFPEGTRTKEDNVIRFKRGAANIAVAMNVAIVPVMIKCHPRALKKGDKWYEIPDGGTAFTLCSGPVIRVDDCVDISNPRPRQYRELTRYLEDYYETWLAQDNQ